MLEEYISQSEAQGFLVSANYYKALQSNEKENISKLKKEKSALLSELETAMKSGTITKNSEAWVEMCNSIDSVTLAIAQSETQLKEYQQTLQQLNWSTFDLLQEKISAVSEEADFLIELLSSDKLYDDNGQLTNEGSATMGLHGQNYNVHMAQADKYGQEAAKLKKELAKDPYDTELEERYREMISLQQEHILAAEQEKNAIRDMVEEGIQLEIEALEERINKYNEAIDSQKNLYDYQKKVNEQTSELSNLRKIEAAYAGDSSEESKKKLQELQVSIAEAEDALAESEYDKYISDQQKLLDELLLEYQETLNTRLDNIDTLISDMITEINSDSAIIGDTIRDTASDVGYKLSDSMKTIWDSNTTNTNNVITTYGEKFTSQQTTTNNALSTINTNLQSMITQLNKIANTDVKSASTSSAENSSQANASATNKNPSSSSKPSSNTSSSATSYPYGKASDTSGNIKYGSKGSSVKAIQYALNKLGYGNSGTKSVDGIFGSGTRSAVKAFQSATGIKVDGIVGKNTRAKFKAKGYATGKKNFLDDEIAWTQENGKEMIIRPSDGAILTPIAKGDSVLTSVASGNIWNMANSPAEFIKENLNLGGSNIPNNSNMQNNYTQHIESVLFNFDNVKNYDEMLNAMKSDRNFERLIAAMTVDRMTGKSSLSKGKSIR